MVTCLVNRASVPACLMILFFGEARKKDQNRTPLVNLELDWN